MVKFDLGQVVMTSGAEDLNPTEVVKALVRHQFGDWGNVDEHDRKLNETSLVEGLRLFSVYHDDDTKFWVITEADRSITTVLLPKEY